VTEPQPLSEDEAALLGALAKRIAELRMTAPAIFLLESMKPLNFVASQAMVFFQPIVSAFFDTTAYDRLSKLLERRDAIEHLLRTIEALEG
jgi:hypothetical protein